MTSFSMILSSLRKETGFSQRQVASDLGISQALLSHYENGAREPKLEFILKACSYYNVTADYILGRSNFRQEKALLLIEALSDAVNELQSIKSSGDTLLNKLKNIDLSK